jgi:NADH-ubiquinone oxidoreductase chain 5
MTKRAIFPFSPWLPIAIAAPTPISALVHSSTLVTAGLFLMIKYSYLLYSSYSLILLLLIFSMFTSFYAGMNTIFEKDLKKLIALSTLRHLGFIGISFSLGLLRLSFFHLLSHALFKSLLFMSIGDIMINLGHSQDIRFLSSGSVSTPNSCFIIYVSLLNLIGVPSLSGFFSKDLILEASNYSSLSGILYLILLLNLVFTFYYTYQLFYFSFSTSKFTAYSMFHFSSTLHSILLLILAIFSIAFGKFFLSHISSFTLFLPLPLFLKFTPYFISLSMFLYLIINLGLFTSNSQILNSYFSTIIFLYLFITKSTRNFYYFFSLYFYKSVERGLLHSSFNIKLPSFFYFIGNKFISAGLFSPLVLSLLLFAFFPFLFLF